MSIYSFILLVANQNIFEKSNIQCFVVVKSHSDQIKLLFICFQIEFLKFFYMKNLKFRFLNSNSFSLSQFSHELSLVYPFYDLFSCDMLPYPVTQNIFDIQNNEMVSHPYVYYEYVSKEFLFPF